MPEQFVVVRNDRPMPAVAEREAVVICGDPEDPASPAVYDRTRIEHAFEVRDRLRDAYDNPAINVYRLTVEPVDDPRGDG